MTHLPTTTKPNIARADDDDIIVVPPEDQTIVVPPPAPDDCLVALPDGSRQWVSLPPDVRALLPRGLNRWHSDVFECDILAACDVFDLSVPLERRRRKCKPHGTKPPVERALINKAVAILGLPLRTVQQLAARGELPGVAKIGRRWTFNLEELRRHVKQRERKTWQSAKPRPGVSGVAVPFGVGSRSAARISSGRFGQVIQRLRGRNTKPGGKD
jgi:excisionase family DNA binding protein